eukprot:9064937-Pyramimonas_sp.AAC.3
MYRIIYVHFDSRSVVGVEALWASSLDQATPQCWALRSDYRRFDKRAVMRTTDCARRAPPSLMTFVQNRNPTWVRGMRRSPNSDHFETRGRLRRIARKMSAWDYSNKESVNR